MSNQLLRNATAMMPEEAKEALPFLRNYSGSSSGFKQIIGYHCQGVAFEKLEQYENASNAYLESLRIFQHHKTNLPSRLEELGICLKRVGSSLECQGKHGAAASAFDGSLTAFRKLNRQDDIRKILWKSGRCCEKSNRSDDAVEQAKELIELMKQLAKFQSRPDGLISLGHALKNKGSLCEEQKTHRQAAEFYTEACKCFKGIKQKFEDANVQEALLDTLIRLGNVQKLLKRRRETVVVSRETIALMKKLNAGHSLPPIKRQLADALYEQASISSCNWAEVAAQAAEFDESRRLYQELNLTEESNNAQKKYEAARARIPRGFNGRPYY